MAFRDEVKPPLFHDDSEQVIATSKISVAVHNPLAKIPNDHHKCGAEVDKVDHEG